MDFDNDMSGARYSVTFKHNKLNLSLHTVEIVANNEHEATEKLTSLLPHAIVTSVVHALS